MTKLDDVSLGTEAIMSLTIDKNTRIKISNSSPYPHCFFLLTTTNGRKQEYTLVADSESDILKWTAHIKQHCQDQALWKQAAQTCMQIQSPTPCRIIRTRKGSLYDETPLKDGAESDATVGVVTENSADISPKLRPRSRSSSSSSSSATSSTSSRPPIPFFRQRLSNPETTV